MDLIYLFNLNIYNYLFEDYINFCLINKKYYINLTEKFFKWILQKKFSIKFTLIVSSQIISWKDCYFRIINFEKHIIKYNIPLWTQDDYFKYWRYKKLIILR